MAKRVGATFVLLCMASVCAHAPAAAPLAPGVLILYSNQRATPAQVLMEDTLRATVSQGVKQPTQVYSEFLDEEWVSLPTFETKQAEFLRDKYESRNIRVIVAVALPALRFAMQFRDQILAGVPIVSLAVARDRVDPNTFPAGVLGNFEDQDPLPTLRLALRLQPDTKRLVLICGGSELDRRWEARFRSAVERLGSGVEVEYLSARPTEEVLRRVKVLPAGTIVFTPGYFNDGAAQVTTPRQSIERIAFASAVPVYGTFDSQIGTGIVGGYMTRYEDQAKEAGTIVVQLLNGTARDKIASASVKRVPIVDWRQVRHWDMDERLLPADTIVLFREPTMWEQHRLEITLAIGILLLQAAMITALLIQRTRRRRAEDASLMLAGRMLSAQEDERRRLARDLHDDVTQRLARLAIDAGRMERNTGSGAGNATAASVCEDLVRLSEDVHALSYRLHPSVLDDLGLAAGIRAECDRLARQESIPVRFESGDLPPKLPREPSLCLFRIAQEALRNVARHARARTVTVSLARQGRGLELAVRDDGQGFDPARDDVHASLGQVSMRERVRLLGGKLRIDSVPGQGTTVAAWVPLEGAAS